MAEPSPKKRATILTKERKLQDCYGNFLCCLSKGESVSMQNSGTITKIGKSTYRYNTPPEPSKSDYSPACLTGGTRHRGDGGDAHALASLIFSDSRISLEQRERLEGWGLITSVKVKIAHQKPEAYRSETRTLHFMVDEVEEMEQQFLAQVALPENSAFLASA